MDLINERGNSNRCGECSAHYPTWASVNLGVFLCGRCAALHRKLGDDISVVKSLTMDTWDDGDLDSIAARGNKRAKEFWNPKNVPFPYDDDDKDGIFLYLRNKYIQGKFRYDSIDPSDYNIGRHPRAGSRARALSRGSRGSSASHIQTLSHRDVPEIQRLKYRKAEPVLRDQGFFNTDDNYEALVLAKGDIQIAAEILKRSEDRTEKKPPLPRRPGTAPQQSSQSIPQSSTGSLPVTQSAEWWTGNGGAATVSTGSAGLMTEPPQQYLDPVTGVIYVDPVQQQQWELQQQQQQQQLSQQQAPQRTGVDKSQLMNLYSQSTSQQSIFPQQTGFQTGSQQPTQNGFQNGFQQPQQTGFQSQQSFQTGFGQQQPIQAQQTSLGQQPVFGQQTGFGQIPQQQTAYGQSFPQQTGLQTGLQPPQLQSNGSYYQAPTGFSQQGFY